jgi:hypothetical protein
MNERNYYTLGTSAFTDIKTTIKIAKETFGYGE